VDRLVFLHGFTQTHHHWHGPAHLVTERLETAPALAFVDLPGHGLARDDRHGDIDSCGPRLIDLAGRGTYVGYSMGGRIALVAAAAGALAVERLVLIGATPGIEDDDERAARARQDEQRARHLEEVGVGAFLDEWLALPMFARLPADPTGVARRRSNTVAGLAHSLRAYGTGAQTPIWDRLGSIGIPVLVVAGALDTKFVDIGERMAAALPRARFTTIADAGHAAHAERPAATATVIADWLSDG
jgi:2-succinyl-6-hydroxy-2,4-cyclohexadiene-1-carboxylate synthase